MTPRDFTVWLQGYLEGVGTKDLSKEDTQKIKDKLNSIFVHESESTSVRGRFFHQTPGTHASAEGSKVEDIQAGSSSAWVGQGTVC